ncbi:MAG: hypothetical protein ACE5F5_12630 [Acidimicrobiia bacterium]
MAVVAFLAFPPVDHLAPDSATSKAATVRIVLALLGASALVTGIRWVNRRNKTVA